VKFLVFHVLCYCSGQAEFKHDKKNPQKDQKPCHAWYFQQQVLCIMNTNSSHLTAEEAWFTLSKSHPAVAFKRAVKRISKRTENLAMLSTAHSSLVHFLS
jgi:hypothetical protein